MAAIYWTGFEDGFAGGVCNDYGFTAKESFAYRNGFTAGAKAAIEAAAAN